VAPAVYSDFAPGRNALRPEFARAEDGSLTVTLAATGVRFRSGLDAMRVWISGVRAEILYAGPHPATPGLDRLQVRVPTPMLGTLDALFELTVDGQAAAAVRIAIP
jgi:uncharacterized protein (TIGR03437 family)